MRTLALVEAAQFLKMHPESVRRRARMGQLPGAKAGKRWVFIEADLADYLRSLYALPRQALRVTPGKENECHFASVEARGGLISPRQAAKELESRLKRRIERPRRNTTTA
ncbi:MAG: DNA-binding protein [Betaproteobacteria bacterium]|nr:MAG: DNA-binding protein [Betaproteobacteria bacterium]